MPAPYFDYAALAPEIIVTVTIVAVLIADLLFEEREKYQTSTIAGVGCLVAMIPVLYLAGDGADRTMFSGAYLVDNYALVMKALFLEKACKTQILCESCGGAQHVSSAEDARTKRDRLLHASQVNAAFDYFVRRIGGGSR